MGEHGVQLAERIEQGNAQLVGFLAGLSDEELRTKADDHGADTVGGVAAHLADGARQVLDWINGRPPTPAEHPLAHDEHVHIDQVITVLKSTGSQIAVLLHGLTDEQFAAIWPAAEGISDGKTPLGEVVASMLAHQAEHVGHMVNAVSERRSGHS